MLAEIWVNFCFLPEPEFSGPLQGCLLYEKPPVASLAWPLPEDQGDGPRAPPGGPCFFFSGTLELWLLFVLLFVSVLIWRGVCLPEKPQDGLCVFGLVVSPACE